MSGSGSQGSGSAVAPDQDVPPVDWTARLQQANAAIQKRWADRQVEREKERKQRAKAEVDAAGPIARRIVDAATLQNLASQGTRKSAWSKHNNDGSVSNKCNVFVFSVMTQAGVPVPLVKHQFMTWVDGTPLYRPDLVQPLAEHWGNPNFKIDHWEIVTDPRPGDVAGDGEHVGVVVGGGHTISQSSITDLVEDTEWGFRDENKGHMVFRRYVP